LARGKAPGLRKEKNAGRVCTYDKHAVLPRIPQKMKKEKYQRWVEVTKTINRARSLDELIYTQRKKPKRYLK